MKIAIMQPYFFPYYGYWQLINYVDTFVILDDVNYINKGWIDRNRILINGNIHNIKLSIKAKSQNKKINELTIKRDEREIEKIIKTIQLNYKKGTNYDEAMPLLDEMINQDEINLACYLINIIKKMCRYLDIQTKIVCASELNIYNKGVKRVIDICKYFDADIYVNPIGGKTLYFKDYFAENNLQLEFLGMKNKKYEQLSREFVPSLSIIDVIMCNRLAKSKKMLMDFYID